MKTMIRVLCVPLLATFLPALVHADDEQAAPPATQPAKVSGDARQLIDQISGAYSALHNLNLIGKITVELQIEGSAMEKHEATFTSAFVAPNRFRHDTKDDALIGSTGQKLYTYQAEQNAYTLNDAPKDRVASKDLPEDLAQLLSSQDPSLMMAISKSPADELLNGVTDASKEDDATIADSACPTLKLEQKDKSIVHISADPQTHLLRQIRFDLKDTLKERRPDLSRALITIDYTKSEPDGAAAADQLFAWAPPPGAKDAAAMASAQPMDDTKASELEGKAAPNFKLEGMDGKSVSVEDLKGKPVVLDFWATWCPPCRASLPHLDELYKKEKGNGLVVYAVNLQEEKGDVADFVKETHLSVPILLDSAGKAAAQYGATSIPETVVIDRDGKVVKVFIGFDPESSPKELQKAVEKAMK